MLFMQGGTEYAMPEPPEGRFWNVVILPNLGREANAFAEHLVRRYDSLAAYTIFSQVPQSALAMHLLLTAAVASSAKCELGEGTGIHHWRRTERL